MDTVRASRGNTKGTRSRKGEIRKRGWMGTLFTDDRTQISNTLDSMDCKWIYQKERCPTTHRIHFHVGIYFNNPRGIGFQQLWPDDTHWEFVKRWPATVKYCSKVSSRVEGPWTNIEGLTFRETIRDPLEGKELYDWQQRIIDIIQAEPDERKVYWFWDPNGNTGKSCLAKHIRMWYKCAVIGGTAKDCFCSLKMRLEVDDIKVVIFDLSRSQMNRVSYNAIEQIKNGMFFSGKYESGDVIINPPHVIVFANFPPERELLSEDRWSVIRLDD